MQHKPQALFSNETIDFDDEYSEEENFESNDINSSKGVPQPNVKLLYENDEIEINAEEDLTDEENVIYDPKVKELNELDKNNKKAILDILMDDDLITKKPIKTAEYVKEVNKTKYPYVKSNLNFNTINTYEHDKKNTLGRTGLFEIETQEGNPEYIKDINVAASKLKNQIIEENKEVGNLLFSDLNTQQKNITRKYIGEKIDKTLNKKKENLKKIEAQVIKKQRSEETFIPSINHRKKDGNKRGLTSFLNSQREFQERVEKKKKDILLKNESEIKKTILAKPQTDKNSEELFKKLYGTENNEPAYLRLYNKMITTEDKLKKAQEIIILREREEEEKRKEKENELKKRNPYKHIRSKFNMSQKNLRENRLKKTKSAENIKSNNNLDFDYNTNINNNIKSKKINYDYKVIQLNKVLLNKFLTNFEEAIKMILDESKSQNNSNSEEIDDIQYFKLLFYLGMITSPIDKNEKNDSEMNRNLNLIEKRLAKNSFMLLAIQGGRIKISDAKNFLICVLGLQNYNLYHMFRTEHEHELKSLFPPYEYKKEEIPGLILQKQNEEFLSKINKKNKRNNKYISLSTDNQIIFTLDKAFLINRDFNKFAINYRSKKNKVKEEKLMDLVRKECPFKPKIGEKSNVLYQKHKEKVYTSQNGDFNTELNLQNRNSKLEYINRILMLDKKRMYENQKIRQEMEEKRISECTFQPNIANYLTNNSDRKIKKGNNKYSNGSDKIGININQYEKDKVKKNIFEELYEDGKQKLRFKKDKTKEEIDLESQKNEFTFLPDITELDIRKVPKTNFKNDIYHEKEYKILYERLKRARLERMADKGKNFRYVLNDELKQFLKDKKEYNYLENDKYLEADDPFFYSTLGMTDLKNRLNSQHKNDETENESKINKNKKMNLVKNNLNEKNYYEGNNKNGRVITEPKKEEMNQKSVIPLLIIDVNIGEGVKKKIYVYKGDTAEGLAENFAKEYNLSDENKKKLEDLILYHMRRLLIRYDEEEDTPNSMKFKNIYPAKNC